MKKVIKNGYVVSMDPEIGNNRDSDILINGNRIEQIGKDLPTQGREVIDATHCAVLPGFVDTHRHTWQTQLRTVAANWTLFDYAVNMRTIYSAFYSENDAYLGNYAGALDSINSGITTIVDHCHLINSPEYANRLIDGLQDSGIRGVFTYGFFVNPVYDRNNPVFSMDDDPAWRYDDCKRVRMERLYDDSAQIIFGVNPSEWIIAPPELLVKELALCRDLGANVISTHVGLWVYDTGMKNVTEMGKQGLIKDDLLFVHGASLTEEELGYIKSAGAGLSTTPEVDLQMALGNPPGLRTKNYGIRTGIGLDITSNYSAEMFTAMRVLLCAERSLHHQTFYTEQQKIPGNVHFQAKEVLYMATMGGAQAIHMEKDIGSLTPGKKADLQLIRLDVPNQTPLGDIEEAIVHYSNVGDVDTVLVDGEIRKQGGKLANVNWTEISEQMQVSCDRIKTDSKIVDRETTKIFWQNLFGNNISVD